MNPYRDTSIFLPAYWGWSTAAVPADGLDLTLESLQPIEEQDNRGYDRKDEVYSRRGIATL